MKASAIVGLGSLQRVVLSSISIFAKRHFKLLQTMEEAKAYLVEVG